MVFVRLFYRQIVEVFLEASPGFLQDGPKIVMFTKTIRVSPSDGGLLSAGYSLLTVSSEHSRQLQRL